MQEVSIDSLQQQVRTLWGESREVRVFLWGGGIPPHTIDLNRGLPWGLSAPASLLFLLCYRLLSLSGRVAVPFPDV